MEHFSEGTTHVPQGQHVEWQGHVFLHHASSDDFNCQVVGRDCSDISIINPFCTFGRDPRLNTVECHFVTGNRKTADMPGTDHHHIAALYPDTLMFTAVIEDVGGNGEAHRQLVDSLHTSHIQKDAAGHDPRGRQMVYAMGRCAICAEDIASIAVVVEYAVVVDMPDGIPLSSRLQRHMNYVIVKAATFGSIGI